MINTKRVRKILKCSAGTSSITAPSSLPSTLQYNGPTVHAPGSSNSGNGLTVNGGGAWSTVGQVVDFGKSFLASKNDSATTNTANSIYDGISTSIMAYAPIGTIVGGAMKVGAFIGEGLLKFANTGTDQMTTTDLIMDSNFFSWNIGALNGGFGKKSNSFYLNKDAMENVGGSYGGSQKLANKAAMLSNKKYGVASAGSRHSANRTIAEANLQQVKLGQISDQATDERYMADNDLNYTNYENLLNGGYDYLYSAKEGGKLEWQPTISETWKPKIQNGTKLKPSYEEWVKDVNPDFLDPKYDLKLAYEHTPFDRLERWKNAGNAPDWETEMAKQDENGEFINHLGSTVKLYNGDYAFVKLGREEDNKEVHFETEIYNDHENPHSKWKTHDLVYEGDRYYYRQKKPTSIWVPTIKSKPDWIPPINFKSTWEPKISFKNGGVLSELKNVIPEGALHARKHHMDNDEHITKKGIPVIDNSGEQLAEIECDEIIFALEVTKKLEELYKQYNETKDDKYAIEAGKILTELILFNTEDNTGLINKCENGGVLNGTE